MDRKNSRFFCFLALLQICALANKTNADQQFQCPQDMPIDEIFEKFPDLDEYFIIFFFLKNVFPTNLGPFGPELLKN